MSVREPGSTWSTLPRDAQIPRSVAKSSWATSAWPQRLPEAVYYLGVPPARAHADHAHPDDRPALMRLRVLLPDSNGAPSAARRDELCTRFFSGQPTCGVEQLYDRMATACVRAGLCEQQSHPSVAPPRLLMFLKAAVLAAAEVVHDSTVRQRPPASRHEEPSGRPAADDLTAEESAEGGSGDDVDAVAVASPSVVARSCFRLLVQRIHQYLEVYAALHDEVSEPHARVTRSQVRAALLHAWQSPCMAEHASSRERTLSRPRAVQFGLLVHHLRHVYSLKPGGKVRGQQQQAPPPDPRNAPRNAPSLGATLPSLRRRCSAVRCTSSTASRARERRTSSSTASPDGPWSRSSSDRAVGRRCGTGTGTRAGCGGS